MGPTNRACRTKPRWHFIWRYLLWGQSNVAELSGRFHRDEAGGEKKKTPNKHRPGTISHLQAAQRENLPRDHRRPRWNRKQDLTFLLLLEPSSLEPARLKVRTAERKRKSYCRHRANTETPATGKTSISIEPGSKKKKSKYFPSLYDMGTSVFQKVHGLLCFMQQYITATPQRW